MISVLIIGGFPPSPLPPGSSSYTVVYLFLIRDFLFTRLRYSADLLYLYFVLLLMCKDLNLFCRRSISSSATVTVFVKEYFRCFVLLSFYSKKFSLCIFIALIALTIALNPPIILDGVRLKLHSVAKSIMPLRMGSRVRIPHRTAAVLAERLSRPFGSVTGAKALGRRERLL